MAAKVAVVTGASAGVGRETARLLAERGYDVALLARGEEGLRAAAREVEGRGQRALVAPTDVADAGAVEAAAAATEAELGPIDVWVNNAMVSVLAEVRDLEPEELHRVTDVTYHGAVHGTLSALRRMVPRDHGTIVQVGSALAYRAIPLQAPYCAAKHALRGFTDSLRCELRARGSRVRLTHVHLPAVNTPQFGWVRTRLGRHPMPVPPIYTPRVAAGAVVWSAEHGGRRELFVGWSALLTVAANKLAPGLLDWHLARTGFDSQQTDEPLDRDRPDNLFEPVPGDAGADGRFTDRARSRTWQPPYAGRRALAAGVAGAAAAAAVALARR